MSLTGKLILIALAALFGAIFLIPVLAAILTLGALVGLFGAAVALWAIVLLGERWIDEGLGAYNFLDALDDALQDVFLGLRGVFAPKVRKSLKSRLVASLGLRAGFWRRAGTRLLAIVAGLSYPFAMTFYFVRAGFREVAKDVPASTRSFAYAVRHGALI